MEEIWKPVPGFDYWVSSTGRVRNAKGNIKKPFTTASGYKRVQLNRNGKRKNFYVHRLVMEIHRPVDNSEELEVDHRNNTKSENHIQNLEWVTPAENRNRCQRDGLYTNGDQRGEKANSAVLTEEDVLAIRKTYETTDVTYRDLAETYRVSAVQVGRIVRWQCWKYI